MTVVVDASVMVAALVDSGPDGGWAESVMSAETLAAPQSILVEATSILRQLVRRGEISRIEVNGARRDLLRRDIELLPFAPFADRVWELRHNVSSYDAWYVAVAEVFECPLATLDRGLSRVVGVRCRFAVPGEDTTTGVNGGNDEPEPTEISLPYRRRGILRGE